MGVDTCLTFISIWYHAAIITLMKPWVGKRLVLRTFDSIGSTPENICGASFRQLKRLMTDFRLSYPQAKYNIQWHPSLLFLANAALANSDDDPEWQFYFMASLYGYGVLSPAYRVAELCFKGLLTFAMETKKIPAAKAQFLWRELGQRIEHHDSLKAHSAIRLNLNSSEPKRGSGTVEDLASRFETVVVLETKDVDVQKDVDVYNDESQFDELFNLNGGQT